MRVVILSCLFFRHTKRESFLGIVPVNEAVVHEPITIQAPFMNMSEFVDLVHEKHPEIVLDVQSYSGQNMTTFMTAQRRAGDMPDIYWTTTYVPGREDLSGILLDLSGYDITNRFSEARLHDVAEDGALYLLPTYYNCFGITYNKTLMEKHGWTLPKTFAELEALAEKAKAAGVRLCVSQIQYPGSGFQYFCHIAQAGFLGTLEGIQWQKDYLTGKANISNTPGMMESMCYIQKWKDIGMLDCSGSDAGSDHQTREEFIKGNTLFMLGNQNGITESLGTEDEFGLMPYISEDGSQNVFILNVNRYYGVNKKLEKNPEKLEDALKIMRVLSTVEGMSSLHADTTLKSNLLPLKEAKADATYFKDIAAVIDAGNTATMIYNGWENTLVNTGTKMLEYMQNQATLEDVIRQVDGDQERVVNGDPEIITTATEVISQENCARLVGRCFAEATGSDLALVSLGTWISGNGINQNNDCVGGKLYAKGISQEDICTILPTGWFGTIKTVELTGKQIKELYQEGYDAAGTGKNYPYVLVCPIELEDEKTYQAAVCGISEKLKSEAKVTDSGVVGMDAAKAFFGTFKTLSEADAEWK